VDELGEVPSNSVTIYSAHGVSPAVRQDAQDRGLFIIDATCPLVAKVHIEAVRYRREGFTILMIGHEGHEEVEGTMGEAPDRMRLVTSVDDVAKLDLDPDAKVAVLTQTTLSVDDTAEIVSAIKKKFPRIELPAKDDICYATQNRQSAVKTLAGRVDLMLVIGSENSSNSQRLKEVAQTQGRTAYLVEDRHHLRPEWFEGVRSVAVTAGASAPERLVRDLIECLVERFGGSDVEEVRLVEESVRFALPPEVAPTTGRPVVGSPEPA
jgi:4-hydroxy-3-methylbut-2-enyl diphosphate reductase